ncbi:MAG: Na+/H+ antiporter subunit B [Synoicihabitans sp.]
MARILLPWLVGLSVVVFYRGHHLPGGGFIGGLLGSLGFVLIALGDGVKAARRALRADPVDLLVWGMAIAMLAGLLGIAGDAALFQGLWWPAFDVPLLGSVHLGTPLLFDAGVFLTVMGFSLKVVFAMREVES